MPSLARCNAGNCLQKCCLSRGLINAVVIGIKENIGPTHTLCSVSPLNLSSILIWNRMSQLSWNECGRLDEVCEHRHRFVHSNITCTPALLLSGYTHPTQYYLRHYNGQIYGGSNTKSNIRIHRQSQLAALLVTVASCVTLSCPTRQHRLHKSRAQL
jgi:hypothetical protein